MPAFVVDIGVIPPLFVQTLLSVPVKSELSSRYSHERGAKVIVLSRSSEADAGAFFATAVLEGFSQSGDGQVDLFLRDIVRLGQPVPVLHPPQETMVLISDADFDRIVAEGNFAPMSIEEAPQADFLTMDTLEALARQVAGDYGNICSFSGHQTTKDAMATPIRPIPEGGSVHASNFLFLRDEAAAPFQRFAWTIGLAWEIIIDCSQIEQEVREIATVSGKLHLPANRDRWPDPMAIAWHRKQFFERLQEL
ncbi:MAG TPA: hypothetical protein VGN79_02140 [Devosia sp.]|nr:hypothetical protein [Devosia sp.]